MIKLVQRLVFMPGKAYGIQQSVAFGTLQVDLADGIDAMPLVNLLSELIGDTTGLEATAETPAIKLRIAGLIVNLQKQLQQDVKIPVLSSPFIEGSGSDEPGPAANNFLFATPMINPEATMKAFGASLELSNRYLSGDQEFSSPSGLQEFIAKARDALRRFAVLGFNEIHFLSAAQVLRIPVTPLISNAYVYGLGTNSRWLQSSTTDTTSLLGSRLSHNKFITATILRKMGLPVPVHQLVKDVQSAKEFARKIGYPVVVKPADQERGIGVFAGLQDESSLTTAYREARKSSVSLLVEKHVHGQDYRLTVFQGEVVKMVLRKPGGLVGDGKLSVIALFEKYQGSAENQDIVRLEGKSRLRWDDEAEDLLAEQGLSKDSIPLENQFVQLRRKNNISAGGTYEVLSVDSAHRDNLNLAVRAVQILGLDIAGVDLIIPDIAMPWHQCNAIVCEVNVKPQIGLRDTPEIYQQLLQGLVPENGLIPLYLYVMVGDDNETDPMADHAEQQYRAFAAQNGCNGISCRSGIWIDGERHRWQPKDSFDAAVSLVLDKQVKSALVIMGHSDVLNFGLPAGYFSSITIVHSPESSMSETEQAQISSLKRLVQPHSGSVHLADAATWQ